MASFTPAVRDGIDLGAELRRRVDAAVLARHIVRERMAT